MHNGHCIQLLKNAKCLRTGATIHGKAASLLEIFHCRFGILPEISSGTRLATGIAVKDQPFLELLHFIALATPAKSDGFVGSCSYIAHELRDAVLELLPGPVAA